MRKFTDQEISVDLLRAIINKSRKYSLVILVTGHGQVGKTTFIWHLANRIEQIKKFGRIRYDDPRITWDEWDAKRLTATNAQDFVKIWNNNSNAVMTLAEASTTLYYMDWMQVMGRVFNSTTTTQGLKRNICFLDTVMASEIMKKAKEKVDYRIWVYKRIDFLRLAKVRSGWINTDFLRDRWMLMPFNTWDCKYSKRELLLAQKYTDWIAETLKTEEARLNEERVGIFNPKRSISDKNMPEWIKNML